MDAGAGGLVAQAKKASGGRDQTPSDNLHISSGRVRTRTVAGCIRGRGLGKPVLLLEVQRALRPSF